ncbi:MAG: hypothetical protein ACI9W4_002679 [Rhodothermales bacterium]|jgi:hypothetical protein
MDLGVVMVTPSPHLPMRTSFSLLWVRSRIWKGRKGIPAEAVGEADKLYLTGAH